MHMTKFILIYPLQRVDYKHVFSRRAVGVSTIAASLYNNYKAGGNLKVYLDNYFKPTRLSRGASFDVIIIDSISENQALIKMNNIRHELNISVADFQMIGIDSSYGFNENSSEGKSTDGVSCDNYVRIMRQEELMRSGNLFEQKPDDQRFKARYVGDIYI